MLWGSRFEKKLDEKAMEFSSSLTFDINLIDWDIRVSKAHAKMLHKIGILSEDENNEIQNGLDTILSRFNEGNWSPDKTEYEDIHSAVEDELTKLIGNSGKKLHTARSRNDQVITDVRLWIKNSCSILLDNINELQKQILNLAERNTNTLMPGYTHLQRAQPISFAFHLLAYMEMLERDKKRILFSFVQADECILGSGALAGSTINLDRKFVAEELGFSKVSSNALDSVSNRDFILDFLNACNITMMHLSRFSEEIIHWTSFEWNFVKLGDQFTTGSSLMPQKKNPDIPELVRGKTGRTYGNYVSLLTVLKSLPLSYNRDLQEDKEGMFDSFLSLNSSLIMFSALVNSIDVDTDRFTDEIDGSFMLATDLADYLVNKGIPFREAHDILGNIVKFANNENKNLNQISIIEFKNFSNLFEEDVYKFLSAKDCLYNKKTEGSPNPDFVGESIKKWAKELG